VNIIPQDGADEVADYRDTFIDAAHLKQSFPNANVSFVAESSEPPYRLSIKRGVEGAPDDIEASTYKSPSMGPYHRDSVRPNATRFTPSQVEGIRSGMNEGLTVIQGPPGTGKSDTAVQIVLNLYHNHPNQKILLVTHSNAALNDLFLKIKERDIDPRHLLRLGGGAKDLALQDASAGEDDDLFSKQGRVNWSLQRRVDMLAEVQRLASSLGVVGDVGYSCETAAHFCKEVARRIDKFRSTAHTAETAVASVFPFTDFFNDVSDSLFTGTAVVH
jgi:intron-binding protein aquarius